MQFTEISSRILFTLLISIKKIICHFVKLLEIRILIYLKILIYIRDFNII